jgi:hypothetical protein
MWNDISNSAVVIIGLLAVILGLGGCRPTGEMTAKEREEYDKIVSQPDVPLSKKFFRHKSDIIQITYEHSGTIDEFRKNLTVNQKLYDSVFSDSQVPFVPGVSEANQKGVSGRFFYDRLFTGVSYIFVYYDEKTRKLLKFHKIGIMRIE